MDSVCADHYFPCVSYGSDHDGYGSDHDGFGSDHGTSGSDHAYIVFSHADNPSSTSSL